VASFQTILACQSQICPLGESGTTIRKNMVVDTFGNANVQHFYRDWYEAVGPHGYVVCRVSRSTATASSPDYSPASGDQNPRAAIAASDRSESPCRQPGERIDGRRYPVNNPG